MRTMMIAWGLPFGLFISVALYSMLKEQASTRRDDSAIDPMLRKKPR